MARAYTTGQRDKSEDILRDTVRMLWGGRFSIVTMREGQGYDWTVITPDAVMIVENKNPGSYELTEKEQERKAAVEAAGQRYWIWQTPEDVIAAWNYYRNRDSHAAKLGE